MKIVYSCNRKPDEKDLSPQLSKEGTNKFLFLSFYIKVFINSILKYIPVEDALLYNLLF